MAKADSPCLSGPSLSVAISGYVEKMPQLHGIFLGGEIGFTAGCPRFSSKI